MAVKSSKNTINRVLNLGLYLAMCFLVGTGVLMWLRLPPGSSHVGRRGDGGGVGHRHGRSGGGEGEGPLTVLGMDRHDWGDLHLYTGLVFLVIGVAHLWFNRVWLKKIAASNKAWRLWAGLAAGAAIGVLPLVLPASRG